MKTDKTVTGTFQVGRFTAEMTIGSKMTCEWSPHPPGRGDLTKRDLEHYQSERNKLIARFIEETGMAGGVLILDV